MNFGGALMFVGLVAALLAFFVWAIRHAARGKRELQAARRSGEWSRFFFARQEKDWYVSWKAVAGFTLSAILFLVISAALGVI